MTQVRPGARLALRQSGATHRESHDLNGRERLPRWLTSFRKLVLVHPNISGAAEQ